MPHVIQSNQGSTPYPPYKPSTAANVLGGVGNLLGSMDESGNMTGIAAIIQAIRERQMMSQSASQYLGLPNPPPNRPVTLGPSGQSVMLSQTARGAPGFPPIPSTAGQQGPLGPLANVPMGHLQNASNLMGKTGISGILGQATQSTLYMNPADGSLSMVPNAGYIPIGGFKGPQAVSAMQWGERLKQGDERLKMQKEHMALADALKTADASSLSAQDKKIIALARINSQALSNPMADFSDEDMASMRETLKQANAILTKSAGISADSSGAPTTKKAKTPVEFLRLNFPSHPETPKNIKWAQEQMSGHK